MRIRNDLLPADKTVMVALSGGADSTALLHALIEVNVSPEACHVNHKLRGEASDRDEQFVRGMCSRLGVELHVRTIDVKALQKKHQSLEEAARDARYACFAEFTGSVIATAHTADDNTETVLFNLTRGTGLRGLCGIPPARDNIIRPLIDVTRDEIIAFLKARNINYVTDETNLSDEFTRNYIRNNVVPLLEKVNLALSAGITRMCEGLRQDEEYLHTTAVSAMTDKADELLKLPPAIRNRIISMILSQNNISPSNLRISGIASLLRSGGKVNLAKDKFAIVENNLLRLETIHQMYRKN